MSSFPSLRIGTRGSDLALWQAKNLQARFSEIQVESELVIIKTQGDRVQDLSFDKLEGKGFFTKELEDALMADQIDVAVHSMKDLPTQQPEGLVLAGLSPRANPADWLIKRKESFDQTRSWRLKENAIVGTSSARRKAQLKDLRPDLEIRDLRGNVPTRVQKLRDGHYDAIVLAAAGLSRLNLNLEDLDLVEMDVREFVPAAAQGVIAYQCREADKATRKLLARIHDQHTAICNKVERELLRRFEGGCHLPLGIHCFEKHGAYHLHVAYAASLDSKLQRERLSLSTTDGLVEAMFEQFRG